MASSCRRRRKAALAQINTKNALGFQNRNPSLPDADPGDVVAHRWRKRFCTKDDAQVEYVVWRDGVAKNKGGRGRKTDFSSKTSLPDSDPGDVVAHRWRFCAKDDMRRGAFPSNCFQPPSNSEPSPLAGRV
jgi:hypothetical protein